MFIKHPTFSNANLFFLLSALTLCTASAVCQQDGDQPPFQRHIMSSESSEISHFLKQAQDGDRIAQFNVASRYLQGVRVPQGYKNAAMWYERAAGQALAAAEFMMGFLYEHGKGVRRDYSRALDYYRAAADQGHATAANNLAGLYLHGLGATKNIGTALKWYQFSAGARGPAGRGHSIKAAALVTSHWATNAVDPGAPTEGILVRRFSPMEAL